MFPAWDEQLFFHHSAQHPTNLHVSPCTELDLGSATSDRTLLLTS